MSKIIPYGVTQVAGVSVGDINASGTLQTGGLGGAFNFGGVIASQEGEPFKPLFINKDNINKVLGKALHPSMGYAAMSLRYAKEALAGGDGVVVPVVPADAVKPVIALTSATPDTDPNVAAAKTSVFGSDVTLTGGELCAIYPVDGDVSPRKLSLLPIAAKPGYFTLKLIKENANTGFVDIQLDVEVSFDPESENEFGDTAYIADVLAATGRLEIVIDQTVTYDKFVSLAEISFTGGSRGDLNNIEAAQYQKAVSVLRNTIASYDAVLPLGIVDPVIIKELHGVVSGRRLEAFFDVPSNLTYAAAKTWMSDNSFDSKESCFYHFPYKASDLYFTKSKALWGISSIAFVAKAKGIAKTGGSVGGYHYSPAGEERGAITRSGVELMPNVGEPDYAAMVNARINKVVPHPKTGQLIIDDALTATPAGNYMRFQHVVSIFHSISRRFHAVAQSIKHEPDEDALETLNDLMNDIRTDYIAIGAIVPPRDINDGVDPMVWTIKQKEIDLFHVTWSICPTGSARRIAGSPIVIK